MPEMPVDPEYGRFIEGMEATPVGGMIVDLPDDDAEI